MRLPRLLILTLLIASWVATAAAQAPQNTEASLDLFQLQLASNELDSGYPAFAEAAQPHADAVITPAMGPHVPFHVINEDKDLTCLTLRTYRVARENPGSDVVRPAGYTTCQPSSRFQVKTAVDSRGISPR